MCSGWCKLENRSFHFILYKVFQKSRRCLKHYKFLIILKYSKMFVDRWGLIDLWTKQLKLDLHCYTILKLRVFLVFEGDSHVRETAGRVTIYSHGLWVLRPATSKPTTITISKIISSLNSWHGDIVSHKKFKHCSKTSFTLTTLKMMIKWLGLTL